MTSLLPPQTNTNYFITYGLPKGKSKLWNSYYHNTMISSQSEKKEEEEKSFHLAGRTISTAGAYQSAVTMGTHSSSKPLVGLEFNLSVYVIYMEILITCRRKEKKEKL